MEENCAIAPPTTAASGRLLLLNCSVLSADKKIGAQLEKILFSPQEFPPHSLLGPCCPVHQCFLTDCCLSRLLGQSAAVASQPHSLYRLSNQLVRATKILRFV
jgi:hypothetical protein